VIYRRNLVRVISNGSELLNVKKDRKVISVSPALDLALNGGILEGLLESHCWRSKIRKVYNHVCRYVQMLKLWESLLSNIDVEGRLEAYNLNGIQGLDLEKFTVIHSSHEEGESLFC